MKKLFVFVAIALLVGGLAGSAFALDELHDTKYVSVNDSASVVCRPVPSTLIGDNGEYEILSISVSPLLTSTSSEAVAAIYDAASLTRSVNTNLECEIEAGTVVTAMDKKWVRPLKIYNGVYIGQGAYSIVTIEYQRTGR